MLCRMEREEAVVLSIGDSGAVGSGGLTEHECLVADFHNCALGVHPQPSPHIYFTWPPAAAIHMSL